MSKSLGKVVNVTAKTGAQNFTFDVTKICNGANTVIVKIMVDGNDAQRVISIEK